MPKTIRKNKMRTNKMGANKMGANKMGTNKRRNITSSKKGSIAGLAKLIIIIKLLRKALRLV